ncbi:MAG: hypothetical protein J2P52_06660 [Blastocatellia bacterium]|nr:hypothetical protein [Blastocatellia bacterium]
MQNEKEKIEYWTESTLLKERGWSKGRIAKLLKNPDKLVPNPHYRTAPKMRLYAQSRVIMAEALPEFVAFKTSALKRAEKAADRRRRQRQLLINRLSCPSVAPLAVYETMVTQRLTPFNESSFPEAFCRDMPETLWLALSPRPEFEAQAIDIVVRIMLAALDARVSPHRDNAAPFDQVDRIFDIWDGQLDLKTGAGVEAFAYVFTEAIGPNDKKGVRLADRRGCALERLNQISTLQWSVGPSFFQQQPSGGDEWLFFAH